MPDAWSYRTTVKPADASTASLALRATALMPATADTTLASDRVDLRIQIHADGTELGAGSLLGSVAIDEIKSWLIKHQASLALDRVGQPTIRDGAVTIPLHAYTYSARSTALSQPSFTAAVGGTRAEPAFLATISLTLRFLAPSRKRAERQATPIDDEEYASGGADASIDGDGGSAALAALLTSAASGSTGLHFSLTPLLETALAKLGKKLVVAFPLCFNSRWMTRLANDQAARQSLASSLCSILFAAEPGPAAVNRQRGHNLQDDDVAREASLLKLTLQMRFGAIAGEAGGPAQGSSVSSDNTDNGRLDDILPHALLHIAQAYSTPDPRQASAPAHVLSDTRASTSFQARAAQGNRQDRQTGESLRSSDYSKVRREQQQLSQAADDDTLISAQLPSAAQFARSDHDDDMELEFDL